MTSGLMSIAACSMLTGCVDDKYDLTDIDTTSQFTVKELTIPVNLEEIRLDKVINLDDNENISTIPGPDGDYYAIKKGGEEDGKIETSNFTLGSVHVNAPSIQPSNITVPVNGIPSIPGLGGNTLPQAITLPDIDLPEVMQEYSLQMKDMDVALKELDNIKSKNPIEVKVTLSVPAEIVGNGNEITFKDIDILLPTGLITDKDSYDSETGHYIISQLPVGADGKAVVSIMATGLELGARGIVSPQHTLDINGYVGVVGGKISVTVKHLNVPNPLTIDVNYNVDSFDIASFSGLIDYNMGSINIDPISLSGLPEFLDDPKTEIRIAHPCIRVSISNPVGQYNLEGHGVITLTSDFGDGVTEAHSSDRFTISGSHSDLSFGEATAGYVHVPFQGLGDILTSENAGGLPKSIEVNIDDINFEGRVQDFPLSNIGKAVGFYEFEAPLGFAKDSKVIYETTVDGWGSDDLNDVNIELVSVETICRTNLPVSVKLTVDPIDRNGNLIQVQESSEFEVPAFCDGKKINLTIKCVEGNPIHDLNGVRFKATVTQDDPNNTSAIGPDLYIELDELKATVSGYFKKEL